MRLVTTELITNEVHTCDLRTAVLKMHMHDTLPPLLPSSIPIADFQRPHTASISTTHIASVSLPSTMKLEWYTRSLCTTTAGMHLTPQASISAGLGDHDMHAGSAMEPIAVEQTGSPWQHEGNYTNAIKGMPRNLEKNFAVNVILHVRDSIVTWNV